ncbi:MAG: cell envelope integrity protein CreD [Flavisolibacter sp.]|nr:cell envelope integrity protein CreD [Flavisolibacter sp.]
METVVQNVWTKTKVLVKALIIGGIVLILQIPTFYVTDLIKEREQRQKEAIVEVSSKWAGRQNIAGPVLVIPYRENADSTKSKHFAYFLPDQLNIHSKVSPEEKYRGIYKVMLYTSGVHLDGSFNNISLEKLKITPQDMIWNEAFVHLGISDVKGLNDNVRLRWNNQVLDMSVDGWAAQALDEGLNAPLNLTGPDDLKNVQFSADLNLNGSQELLFTPLGRTTSVEMKAKWPHPSFTGDILPMQKKISRDSFEAKWKSISQKRNFPQQWKDNSFIVGQASYKGSDVTSTAAAIAGVNISNNAFGADLYDPVSGYQKTLRSVKYSFLCILLTFAAFFLIETSNKKSVHPFQYGLVGLALVLFYTLLLSFSEYIGFNFSYAIAAAATIGLIAWFIKGILSSSRLTVVLSVVLLLIYTYVFTILQLQDYALLLGSIGLFITLAVIMHFSKKIQW